jgi:hypothetical protein
MAENGFHFPKRWAKPGEEYNEYIWVIKMNSLRKVVSVKEVTKKRKKKNNLKTNR